MSSAPALSELSRSSSEQLCSLLQFLEMNRCDQNDFFKVVHNTLLQFVLQQICTAMAKDPRCHLQVKKLYFKRSDNDAAAKEIALLICGIVLSDEDSKWLNTCLHAHFSKKQRRIPVPDSLKQQLLEQQQFRCACCGQPITLSDCYDHIIPWELVGDELSDNGQMLCSACNLAKNAKVYFQFQRKLISPYLQNVN